MQGNQSIDRTNSNMPEYLFDVSFKELINHISCYFKFESTWRKRLGLCHFCRQILKVFLLKTKPSFVVKCIYIIPYLTEHVQYMQMLVLFDHCYQSNTPEGSYQYITGCPQTHALISNLSVSD